MPDQKFLCSRTFFNSEVQDVLKNEPVKQIELLSNNNYRPEGMTALLDAVGGSIDRIEKQFGKELENDEISVVMIIITDGYENASKYFTYHMVAQKIVRLDIPMYNPFFMNFFNSFNHLLGHQTASF